MNNYEKIKRIIELGHIAQIETESGNFRLYSSMREEGTIRVSFTSPDIKVCYDTLGGSRDSEDEIHESNIKEITVYQQKLHYYKEGDRVVVLPSFNDLPKYNVQQYIGKTFIVESMYSSGSYFINTGNNCTIAVGHIHLAPYLGPDEIIEVDGFKYKLIS